MPLTARYNADMDGERDRTTMAGRPPGRFALRVSAWAALAAGLAAVGTLACRTISSPDIGYHLAYGEHFLDGNGIVDDNAFIYTSVERPGVADDLKIGPGCRIDADGRYRFPNANYASQIVMAGCYRLGDVEALCVLQVALVAAVFALLAATMLRMSVPVNLAAAGILLAAAVSYERFNLRPELFGYVILAVQLLLLAGRRIGPAGAAGLILAQWAFVQFHVYWPLGIALTFCFLADAILRWIWAVHVAQRPLDHENRRRLKLLAITMAGQVVVVFANPWTWRLVAFPFQVAFYMARNSIRAGGGAGHPWSTVGELMGVFSGGFSGSLTTPAIIVLLVLTGAGVICAAAKRRWASVLIMLGFAYMCLFQTRRRVAVGAFVLVPGTIAACMEALRGFFEYCKSKSQPGEKRLFAGSVIRLAAPLLLIALSGWWIARVATNRFYYNERRSWRFGAGWNRLDMPIRLGKALRTLPAGARVFTSFNVSSNLLHFSRSGGTYREMPILTNGFAYPPDVMEENIRICAGYRPFEDFAKRYDVKAVALDCTASWSPLIQKLLLDHAWTPAYIDASFILFVRGDVPTDLRDTRKAGQFVADVKSLDPLPAFALFRAGRSFYFMGLGDLAIRLAGEATKIDEDYYEAWTLQGLSLLARAKARPPTERRSAANDLREARRRLKRALDLRPDYVPATKAMRDVDGTLKSWGG